MKKLFVVLCAAVTFIVIAPNQAEASYSDRGAALGLGAGLAIDFKHIEDFKLDENSLYGFHVHGKISGVPIMFGFDIDFAFNGYSPESVNISMDWWLLNPTLIDLGVFAIGLYIGPGIDLGLDIKQHSNGNEWYDPTVIDIGARLPIGLSWVLFDSIEIFTEVLFTLDVLTFSIGGENPVSLLGMNFSDTTSPGDILNAINTGANIGFRFWF